MFEYDAVVDKVHDGDTIHVQIDLGFNIQYNAWVRLNGINAPELGTIKDPIVEGEQSTIALMALLGNREQFSIDREQGFFGKFGSYTVTGKKPEIRIRTQLSDSTEKYGRVLGAVFMRNESTVDLVAVNTLMVQNGHAEPLHYG